VLSQGKIFGPIGFVFAVKNGELPVRLIPARRARRSDLVGAVRYLSDRGNVHSMRIVVSVRLESSLHGHAAHFGERVAFDGWGIHIAAPIAPVVCKSHDVLRNWFS
jgi:hypothetical protein